MITFLDLPSRRRRRRSGQISEELVSSPVVTRARCEEDFLALVVGDAPDDLQARRHSAPLGNLLLSLERISK
jgi:hypothetical protein